MNSVNRLSSLILQKLTRSRLLHDRLPAQLFYPEWQRFYFVDSDVLTWARPFSLLKRMCALEHSVASFILNVGECRRTGLTPDILFVIDQSTTESDFRAYLMERGLDSGWSAGLDDLAAISESGNWIIYCERINDVGLCAFAEGVSGNLVEFVRNELEAEEIQDIFAGGSRPIPPYSELVPEWRKSLIEYYTNEPSRG